MQTKKKLKFAFMLACLLLIFNAGARAQRMMHFPDIPGYKTLKCDLHMHTVFSDGTVWPTVRVDEAVREGLDLIAITDHIEYQPHKKDVPANHNRPHEIAAPGAKEKNILLPLSAEITYDTPPGHFNAIFLKDVNPLDVPDFLTEIKAANDQSAFVFWNHHDWKGQEKGGWFEDHHTIYKNGWLHGMEVSNGRTYYPRAHQWCLEKNMTMIGASDTHGPSLIRRSTPEEHRTMTLVFAKESTLLSVKEALFAGRTLVWYRDQLIGKKEFLGAMFQASVLIHPTNQINDMVRVVILNNAAVNIDLERTGDAGPKQLTLPANTAISINLQILDETEQIELSYTTRNFLMAPEKPLPVNLVVPLQKINR